MDLQRCKGMRDWLPPDMYKFRYIEAAFRRSCLQWGYQEIRTPTLEYLYLFTAAGTLTPQMLSRVYSFLDWDGWSGERVVLRPDSTIPAARLFLSNKQRQELARLFYVQSVFSFEETGKEARERWQCGVELMGSNEPAADVELMLLGLDVLHSLDLRGVEVRLSHLGLVRALLDGFGLEAEQKTEVLDRVLEGNGKALTDLQPPTPQIGRALSLLVELKGDSPGFLKNLQSMLLSSLPGIVPSLNNFIRVTELLSAAGCPYQIDIAAGKGFEYYTGVVFQFRLGKEVIGAGGRYNELIPLLGGGNVPASGFALYVEPLMAGLDITPEGTEPFILITTGAGNDWKSSFTLAEELRAEGYVAGVDLGGQPHFHWQVSMPAGPGLPFILTDSNKTKRLQLNSVVEVLKALEAIGAAKISPA